ncbi:MAG: hypothetical protein ABGZ24_25860, partial [Fuerstiella sp.]
MRLSHMKRYMVLFVTFAAASTLSGSEASEITVRELQRFAVPEAHQAVAVDATSFYAIANRTIARYEKATAKPLAKWTAPAGSPILHLNSGIVLDGRLYCANSNWPKSPLKNSVEIFEAKTLEHLERREFSEAVGAI